MKRYVPIVACVVLALSFAAQAAAKQSPASQATVVKMTFEERLNPSESDCPDLGLAFNCGKGAVVPFGGATEEIIFGIGCGGACDFRQVDLQSGSIFVDETAGGPVCGDPSCSVLVIPLSDTVIGGTGQFSGASGSLSGSVTVPTNPSAGNAHIALDGTITLAS